MAQYAWNRGWKTAALATDTVIVYFRDVVQAFEVRFKQLGGRIVAKETYQSLGGNNVQNAVTRLNGVKAGVYVTSTAGAFGALSTMVSGLRSLGNNTPILNSWAGDGTYWLPNNPKVTNYYFVTFASSFGDDPSKAVNSLAKKVKAATGGFITGPSAIDGVVTAIKRAHGSTKGIVLAKTDGALQERADDLGQRQLLDEAAHGVRAAVQGDPDPEQRAEGRRHDRRQGRRKDLTTTLDENRRRPGETLRASVVSRSFEGVHALREVTLELGRGEVVGLIGPNGAGKSTLVNVLSGFDRPTSGTVELEGQDVTRWRPGRRGRHGLARTFQHSHAFRALSVRENVEVAALGVGAGPREARDRAARVLELLGLSGQAAAQADTLAQGDERRLGVARAVATSPRFLLLDEPAAGLPETEVTAFAEAVRTRPGRGRRGDPADRPQHGADHGGLRPDPRPRPGTDARRGCAGGDSSESRRRRGVSRRERGARRVSAPLLAVDDLEVRHGAVDAVRGLLARGRPWRDRRPDRSERRRKVVDAARDHGARPADRQATSVSTASRSSADGRRTSPDAGSRWSPRGGGSSRS